MRDDVLRVLFVEGDGPESTGLDLLTLGSSGFAAVRDRGCAGWAQASGALWRTLVRCSAHPGRGWKRSLRARPAGPACRSRRQKRRSSSGSPPRCNADLA